MDIQTISYIESPPSVSGGSCDVKVFDKDADVASACCTIGDVFVGDTGWSTNCERDRVISEVKTAACSVGANAASVRELSDSESNCYQVRARLLHCPAALVAIVK
jgi:hypothetical protein